MTVRDLKLAIAIEYETEEVKSLHKFFENLFSGLTLYQKEDKPDLIFMKGYRFIMEQDLKNGYLLCRYDGFWQVLESKYHCEPSEIKEIIKYMVEEKYKMELLTPRRKREYATLVVEEEFKTELLTPYMKTNNI